MKKIPKSQLIKSKYRKDLWQNANKVLAKIEKVLSISSIHLLGSFTTKKRRPADVDFIVMVHTSDNKNAKWALDLVIAPDNKHGKWVLEDAKKWMKQKYGVKKSEVVKFK